MYGFNTSASKFLGLSLSTVFERSHFLQRTTVMWELVLLGLLYVTSTVVGVPDDRFHQIFDTENRIKHIQHRLLADLDNSSHNRSGGHFTFLGKFFSVEKWKELKEKVDCWATNGEWKFNDITIIDDWSSHNPCVMYYSYGPRNPCNWLLDGDVLKYTWNVSDTCPRMSSFSTEKLCQMMKGRGNIMIVGDSVNELLAAQLVVDISLSSNTSCLTHTRRKDIFARETIPCQDRSVDDPLTLTIVRNDYLSIRSEEVRTNKWMELSWEDAINPHNIGLLILNRGARYVEDSLLMEQLNSTMRYLHGNHPNVSIVWRNTPHGITFKESFFAPPLSNPPPIPHRNGWENFPRQNAMVYKFLAEEFPNVLHLDVAHSAVLRLDAHHDEIHFCVPGPLRVWVDLLFNAIELADGHNSATQSSSSDPSAAHHTSTPRNWTHMH